MEIFELRYFAAVAQTENVNKAAESIHVSAGSLSKAIARLESELQAPLFYRSGRGIKLTPEGRLLKKKAAQLLALESDIRTEITGQNSGAVNLLVSSEEVLQVAFLPRIARSLTKLYPQARLQGLVRDEAGAIEQVREGEVQLALVTTDPPKDLVSKVLTKVEFRTCVGPSHPLAKRGKAAIPVEQVLEHRFVIPSSNWLGLIAKSTSPDGWRDDKFQRQIAYRVSGLKLMEVLIREGFAVGYLPDYFVEGSGLMELKITGCPYSCQQTVRVVANDPTELGWLNRLWDELA